MTENKTTLRIPDAYLPLLEDIRLLTADQNNPNRTTIKQQQQIWCSLQKYGWAYPIITNKDGVYADGEQRAEVCKQHGEFYDGQVMPHVIPIFWTMAEIKAFRHKVRKHNMLVGFWCDPEVS